MNGSELYTLNTSLLGGNAIDEDLFYQLLNMAKDQREMMRDWMKLRTEDTTITFASSDTYLSTKTLPDRFLRTYSFYDYKGEFNGPFIITTGGSKVPLLPIKFEERYDYKDIDGYYYIDVKNSTIGRTGTTAGTLHLFFLQGTVDIASGTTWTLPPTNGYSALLAYDVAIEQKGGIDWDRINASQIPYNERKMKQLEVNLSTWDARLQQQELAL
jgi:hypothetical protein